jgi:uncharacterized protein
LAPGETAADDAAPNDTAADDLSAPLGRLRKKRRRKLPISLPQAIATALALFLGVFVLWAAVGDNPFGGEPIALVDATARPTAAPKSADVAPMPDAAAPRGVGRYDGPSPSANPAAKAAAAPPGATKTVTIIDGKTGARQEVVIPDTPASNAPASNAAASNGPSDQKFAEMTSHGPIPKIAPDGTRPADIFARPVKAFAGKPDSPRIALIVEGLGVSKTATGDAIAKLPGAVTLGFMPYGNDIGSLVSRARNEGHEVLLQVPMEPFD